MDDCLKDFDEDTEHTYMAEMPKVHIRDGDAREIYETVLPPDAIKIKRYIDQYIISLNIMAFILRFK